mmetsp:Transcript_59109/g.151981  ORF Transcript_59109/g.151981 Transcript_59109/m.151981 type:complete len:215 (+) Transcript_59109:877-1521(+)
MQDSLGGVPDQVILRDDIHLCPGVSHQRALVCDALEHFHRPEGAAGLEEIDDDRLLHHAASGALVPHLASCASVASGCGDIRQSFCHKLATSALPATSPAWRGRVPLILARARAALLHGLLPLQELPQVIAALQAELSAEGLDCDNIRCVVRLRGEGVRWWRALFPVGVDHPVPFRVQLTHHLAEATLHEDDTVNLAALERDHLLAHVVLLLQV